MTHLQFLTVSFFLRGVGKRFALRRVALKITEKKRKFKEKEISEIDITKFPGEIKHEVHPKEKHYLHHKKYFVIK